jgi:hypothetical protein
VRCYGKHVEEHIGNPMGTKWKFKVNIVGTHCERGKNEKPILPPPSPQNFKGKKARHLECIAWVFPLAA